MTSGNPSWRKAKRYTHQGRALTLREWEGETGISAQDLRNRLKYGMSIGQAIAHPKHSKRARRELVAVSAEQIFRMWAKSPLPEHE